MNPELKAPKSLNASSQLTLLIGNLIQILGEKSLTALTNKLLPGSPSNSKTAKKPRILR
ncbi:hypothetical protein [Shigella dysenteriae]|uniref:hypothetical protein n=1 Tax=Shigella dysenteriae TaxID=622 RepID=UPI0010083ECD